MKPNRSLLVSWLLGASVVALVTFSFEALSAREASPASCPASGKASAVFAAQVPSCPATAEQGRCPATGATARSTTPSARCPVTGATAQPAAPSGRCPAAGDASDLLRPGLRL
jgi:hypothetical protein